MKYLVITLLIFSTLKLQSQSVKEKIAERHFDNLEYMSAFDIYQDLAGSSNPKIKYYLRAGECNLHIGNYPVAQLYYDRVYSSDTAMRDKDLYNYYQVLKYNSKYDKASEVFAKISQYNYKLIRNNLDKKKLAPEDLKKDSSNYVLKRLSINSDDNDFCPYVVNNEMYFLSSRRNTSIIGRKYGWDNSYYLDVYKGYIEGGDVVREQVVKEGIRTKAHEGPICFTKDGNMQFITRSNFVNNKYKKSEEGQVNLKLFFRKKENDLWSEWTELPFNTNEYSCADPAVSTNGKVLYFASDMPGGLGSTDIWVTRFENGKWTKPENLGPAVNSEGREAFPYLFEDEVLFYSSDGKVGLGGLDIFYTVPFFDTYFEAQNMGYPVNSNFDDFGFCAKSVTEGYFSSNRGKAKDDIYSFVSNHPIVLRSSFSFIVKDNHTKEIIPNAKIFLNEDTEKDSHKNITDNNGEFKINFLDAKSFKIVVNKKGYNEATYFIKASDLVPETNSKKEILIEKKVIGLFGTIVNADNDTPIEGVRITITDNNNKTGVASFITHENGGFEHLCKNKKMGDTLSYLIKLEKEGYLTKEQSFEFKVKKEAYIQLNDFLNTKMYKLKLGTDIGKVVDILPIYFDLGKSIVSPDARLELDKIVLLLKQNQDIVIELSSHSDCRGKAAENLALSDRRAKASAGYIISKGISPIRIYGKGYGESKLINGCRCEDKMIVPCDEEQHAQNRRTEFKIVKIKP